ncbi:hypothetical protein Patl1_07354 [Pistacia atlantica]|uniref:Uncharacterized protein n=1 Tax=Pistacia atlantica TaxID=434234 RepID=A0ACC1AHS5_9ROSI|nr:hypothetical protein Patl1_07354 [Pistacia atlantica]
MLFQRFSIYPNVNVGLLSRFQTTAEKEEYLDMIKQGHLNIIVGTHSLLGSHVVFNNLGLLVVDEEQRIGVKQKEKIAPFKTSVDVLTLSATPIPRTLYLALTGFRDASLISTPPPERVPIKTHLSAFSKEKVISAVKNEVDRDGQAFPNVDIAIAHGQQYSKQLEETMEKFSRGIIKILICTNIVENKEAHAHLFYPDKSLLSDEALSIRYPGCVYRRGLQLFKNAANLTGDVGNVGIDLFFEMLFESLSKISTIHFDAFPFKFQPDGYICTLYLQITVLVDEHRVITVPY